MMLTLFYTDAHTHTCTDRQAPPCFLYSHNQTLPSLRQSVVLNLLGSENSEVKEDLCSPQTLAVFFPPPGASTLPLALIRR